MSPCLRGEVFLFRANKPVQPTLGSDGGKVRLVSQPPRDNQAYRFPVSVKGVVVRSGRVVLLRNEREEWELPGGKLEPNEAPEVCVVREIEEELQLRVAASRLLDSWVYAITERVKVLIVTYGCSEREERDAVLSTEHKQLHWFPLREVESPRCPPGTRHRFKRGCRSYAGAGERQERMHQLMLNKPLPPPKGTSNECTTLDPHASWRA